MNICLCLSLFLCPYSLTLHVLPHPFTTHFLPHPPKKKCFTVYGTLRSHNLRVEGVTSLSVNNEMNLQSYMAH